MFRRITSVFEAGAVTARKASVLYWHIIVLVSALVALLETGADYKIGATTDKTTGADPYSAYYWSKGRNHACEAVGGTCAYG